MGGIVGGGSAKKGQKLAKRQAEESARRQLADLARQQSEVDQAAAGPGVRRGRKLLTYALAGGEGGGDTLGG